MAEHPSRIIAAPDFRAFNATRPQTRHRYPCYAPLTHMYFGHGGKVSACCYNRKHLMGTWPGQSISEIWESASTLQLRQWMAQRDLGGGCNKCRIQIESGNFEGSQAKSFDHFPLHPNGMPSAMSFELENTCNLECVTSKTMTSQHFPIFALNTE